ARPMPLLPPVTSATFPSSLLMFLLLALRFVSRETCAAPPAAQVSHAPAPSLRLRATTSRRTASTTASGCVIGIMCAAPGTTMVVAPSAAVPSRRAAARGARSVLSPTRMVVGGGDSANHASFAVLDRAAVISNRSVGTRDVTIARPRLPIDAHAPAPLQ